MKKICTFFSIIFILLSCENETIENPIQINQITTSKTIAFTEETITLTIDGSGFDKAEINIISNNVISKKINDNTFEINSNTTGEHSVKIKLTDKNFSLEQSIDIEFIKHGIINFDIIEGVSINHDYEKDLLDKLGEPNYKTTWETAENILFKIWDYTKLGIRFYIKTSTSKINHATVYNGEFIRYDEKLKKYTSGIYPYEIGFGLNFTEQTVTTDDITNVLGTTFLQGGNQSNNTYYMDYNFRDAVFYYSSDDINNYQEKKVLYIVLY